MGKRYCRRAWVPLALLAVATSMASADTIKGQITDSNGKPVRGAVVKASEPSDKNKKFVAVYSQKDGRFSIAVPKGNYDVVVEAFGFAPRREKKDTSQSGDLKFAMVPKWEVTGLTGAEVESLIPNDAEGKLIKSTCIVCHDLAMPLRKRGYTAEQWKTFLPTMTKGRLRQPTWSDAKLNTLGKALEKYYGPNSAFAADVAPPAREKVKHADIEDAALSATITEWTIPTGVDSFPHSIEVDLKRGIAWFSEVGDLGMNPATCALFTPTTPDAQGANCGNRQIGRFDIKAEKFVEFTTPSPHTPAITADGRAWYSETMGGKYPSLAVVDPNTNKIEYFKHDGVPHTPIVSHDDKIWLSGKPGIWSFDPATKQFKQYTFTVPAKVPEHSLPKWQQVPGEPEAAPGGSTYHLAEDSHGNLWGGISDMGMIVRLDPKTGETKEFFPPETLMIRGIAVDHNDNVWFAAYYDHKLGKLDPKTGTFKMYQPPSQGAAPYGVVEDKKTGCIWFGDQTAYTVTRFDPKTEKFVEYRLPGNPALPGSPAPPRFITVDTDGKVWFTDFWNGRIGVVDPNGAAKQVASR